MPTPDSVASLTAYLATVSVSRQSRLSITFGDFPGTMLPDGQLTLQGLATSIDANKDRATEGLNELRDAMGDKQHESKELILSLHEVKHMLHGFGGDLAALRLANPGVKMYGPESPEEVQHLLRDRPAREIALKTYTVEWLTKTKVDRGLGFRV